MPGGVRNGHPSRCIWERRSALAAAHWTLAFSVKRDAFLVQDNPGDHHRASESVLRSGYGSGSGAIQRAINFSELESGPIGGPGGAATITNWHLRFARLALPRRKRTLVALNWSALQVVPARRRRFLDPFPRGDYGMTRLPRRVVEGKREDTGDWRRHDCRSGSLKRPRHAYERRSREKSGTQCCCPDGASGPLTVIGCPEAPFLLRFWFN